MKIIRTGITRNVILTKKYAIKYASFKYGFRKFIEGIAANYNEEELYSLSTIKGCYLEKINKFLCPVIYCSPLGFFIIMKRCSQEVRVEAPIHELLDIVGDHKEDNYGILNNRIVMLDYASTKMPKFPQKTHF